MNIKTLASIYDTVYVLADNKVVETKVTYIFIEIFMIPTNIRINYQTDLGRFQEDEVFLTKQALLDSL